jgi:hypothetical protein
MPPVEEVGGPSVVVDFKDLQLSMESSRIVLGRCESQNLSPIAIFPQHEVVVS